MVNCTQISEDQFLCNGKLYDLHEEKLTYHDNWFWIYISIYCALVLFAGMMSGLTMGLLSLDMTTLLTLIDGGTPTEKKHAKRILPVIKRHHLLLVTLLLANAVAVEAMPIFLDRVSNPIIAIVISVTAVLIFGEVIPQAVCTRFGLAIGSYMTPVVYFMMALFFVIAFPLSKILDWMLGEEHGTFFRRAQLKALIDIHGNNRCEESGEEGRGEETLTNDEVMIIKGALDMKNKTAKDAMVNVKDVFMLSLNDCLDADTMSKMLDKGHSRLPVYGQDRSNIVAYVLTKTLIKFDPDDAVSITEIVSDSTYAREPMFINDHMPLFDLLNEFQTGRSHLAFVRSSSGNKQGASQLVGGVDQTESSPLLINIYDEESSSSSEGDVIGIITLEDVIEELLQEEIDDETDIAPELSKNLKLSFARVRRLSQSREGTSPRD